jgi:hypothetical protein
MHTQEDDPRGEAQLARELEALEARSGQVSLGLRLEAGSPPVIVIESLRLGRDARYWARATKALDELKAIADEAGAAIVVPLPEAGQRLREPQIDFYGKHGFAFGADERLCRRPADDRSEAPDVMGTEQVPDTIPEAWSLAEWATPPWARAPDETAAALETDDPEAWPLEDLEDEADDPCRADPHPALTKLAKVRVRLRARFVLTVVSLAVVAGTDSLRTAALAAGVAGTIALTRLRFASYGAVALLLAVTMVSLAQEGPARSAPRNGQTVEQPSPARLG